MVRAVPDARERRLGRYLLHGKIAAGGMATVHFGRLVGEGGFSRVVAIKRMGSHLAEDPEFRAMFLDEARLASRIRHPNVISTIDVGSSDEGLFLVMEYVAGESLASLLRAGRERGSRIPVPIAIRVSVDTLYGLHAAHTATDEGGRPLCIVHRDVSPQNILVGADGLARVLDFGIAKAAGSNHTTREGQLKGKFRYMAPEQVSDKAVTPRTDVYAASVVLWETLTGEHLFGASNDAAIVARVLEGVIAPPSKLASSLPKALDAIVLKGLARDPEQRFASALDMGEALEALGPLGPLGPLASARQVGAWVEDVAGAVLARRREQIARMDSGEADETVPSKHPVVEFVTQTHTLDVPARPLPDAAEEPATRLLTPAKAVARSKGGLVWYLVGGGLLLLLGAVGFGSLRGSNTVPPVASKATPVASSGVAPMPMPEAVEASTPSVVSTGSVAPVASVPPRARPEATTPAVVHSARAVTPKAPAVAKPDCDPPTYEDTTGIRRVKPGCI